VFAVADDGKVSIQSVEKAEFSFDADTLLARAEAIGWSDLELLEVLRTGAERHADAVDEHVDAEVEKGFVVRTLRPSSIPAVWRPTNMVPKSNGKLRFVIDRSALGDVEVWVGRR
jgi:hypothetical protein